MAEPESPGSDSAAGAIADAEATPQPGPAAPLMSFTDLLGLGDGAGQACGPDGYCG